MNDDWKIKLNISELEAIRKRLGAKLNEGYWLRSDALKASINPKEVEIFEKKQKKLREGISFTQENFYKNIKVRGGLLIDPGTDELLLVYIIAHRFLKNTQEIENNPGAGNKFHFSQCQTIQEKLDENKYYRQYVKATRRDGWFAIHMRGKKEEYVKLNACGHCLQSLKYNGYNYSIRSSYQKEKNIKIVKNFNVENFLNEMEGIVFSLTLPSKTDLTAPIVDYNPGFAKLSLQLRKEKNFTCQVCAVNLKNYQRILHVHHKNYNPSDDRRENLLVACVDCHMKFHRGEPVAAKNKLTCLKCQEIKREQGIRVE